MLIMANSFLSDVEFSQSQSLDGVYRQLAIIKTMLKEEIGSKQATMEQQQDKITALMSMLETKNKAITGLSQKLEESQRQAEGNRQMVNKLLNDIDRLQQDVAWYQRTYEKRSLLGYLKQKLIKK
jgi:chromosome segregation ATPase